MFESYKHWMNFSYKIESPRIQFILFLFIFSQQKFIWNFMWTVRYSLHSMKTCNFWIFFEKNYELFVCIQSVFVVSFLFFCLIFYSFYVCGCDFNNKLYVKHSNNIIQSYFNVLFIIFSLYWYQVIERNSIILNFFSIFRFKTTYEHWKRKILKMNVSREYLKKKNFWFYIFSFGLNEMKLNS